MSHVSRRRSSRMLEHKLMKTTCRSTPFQIWWWWSERSKLTLYKGKPLEEPQGVVRETAGWTRPGLTLGTSTSASTRPSWRQSYIAAMSCGNDARVEGLDVILDNPAVQCTQRDPGGWSDVSA